MINNLINNFTFTIKKRGLNHNLIFSIFLLLAFVFLSGCSSYSTPSLFNVYSGTGGLSIKFLNNAPPDEVYSGTPYIIGFELDNYGAEDIKHAYLVLGTDDFSGAKINQTFISFDLNGKKTTHGFWGERSFKIIKAESPKIENKKESSVLLTYLACYPYLTKAQVSVCVNTNPFVPTARGCVPKPIDLDSQGAPVAVTHIEESTVPLNDKEVELRFRIQVENKGKGIVVQPDKYNTLCLGKSLGEQDLNSLDIYAQLAGSQLDCSPATVKLTSSDSGTTGEFVCMSKPLPIKDAYKSLLMIKLNYGYILSGVKQIAVYNPNYT